MATTALSEASFESTVTSGGIVLVDFWAEWCGPCKRFGPIFEAASDKNEDIVFGKVDTEAAQDLSAQLGIQAIPTLMAFKDGKLLFRNAGALNAAQLDNLIAQVREYDTTEGGEVA
ncbi:thioredoxin [uncultured Propionibacterium sp.]|uniref:thioredoxin n=1 Tax=uncultured Propionibacterium sp. TaxID=218066 RepID=UPI002931EEE1|nr:thioredoxin [uncultured Propionibacterium sp.]